MFQSRLNFLPTLNYNMSYGTLLFDISQYFANCSFTILSLAATVLFFLMFMYRRPKNFPPGSLGLPLLGVAPFVGRRPEKTFNNWRKKYGDLMGFRIGNEYTVVLSNYELIQEALVKKAAYFSHRPNNFVMRDTMHKSGLTMSDYTENYAKERKFTSVNLSKLGFGKKSMEKIIINEARTFVEYLGTTNGQWTEKNMKTLMHPMANIICEVAIGKSYDYEDSEFLELVDAYHDFFKNGSFAYQMTILLPGCHHFPPVRHSAQIIKKSWQTVDRIMMEKIEEHEETLDPSNIRDFIDAYLLEMKNKDDSNPELYTKKMLSCMCRDFLGGGIETGQVMLLYLFIVLANRPEMQKRIIEEIEEVIGTEGIPEFSTRERMPYVSAVIREILRYRTVGPFAIAHCAAKDITLKGYTIPKGTTVLPNIYAVHNDPQYWENPDQFIPERHLDEDGRLQVAKYLIPFGIGPRSCPGRRLAEVELFVFAVSILQKFQAVPTPTPECDRPWVEEDAPETGMTLGTLKNIPVTMVPR